MIYIISFFNNDAFEVIAPYKYTITYACDAFGYHYARKATAILERNIAYARDAISDFYFLYIGTTIQNIVRNILATEHNLCDMRKI